tara:strand:+ start:3136 stop:4809 length:1674 start_codon:yes stop_codon:yes gene_type:complete
MEIKMNININQGFYPCDKADLSSLPEFQRLAELSKEQRNLRQLFAEDDNRFSRYSLKLDELLFDFSKNLIDDNVFTSLGALVNSRKVAEKRDRMFAGDKINRTEGRAVLHVASRAKQNEDYCVDGCSVTTTIIEQKAKMRCFIDALYSGQEKGCTNQSFTDVVNLGVGGSDLGGVMATQALKPFVQDKIKVHFVSTIDGTQLIDLLPQLNLETTLFILCSKSFTTIDTMSNVATVKDAYENKLGEESWKDHFAGVSANTETMAKFGIPSQRQFIFGDYIGGRYSVSSTIGLPVAIAIGMDNFEQMLDGMHLIDTHFKEQPFESNIPMIMGALQVWNINFLGAHAQAILPYAQHLHRFPAYLTQMEMESLGKTATQSNKRVDYHTGAVIFGEMGSNGQHSFYQLLHQGTRFVMADFITPINGPHENEYHQRLTLGNCLAQSKALAFGYSLDEIGQAKQQPTSESDIHKVHSGNRPSNTILIDRVVPKSLGMLIALYEHKVFVQAAIWGINAYDQWGVELGKKMASGLYDVVGQEPSEHESDASTLGLLQRISDKWQYS